MTDARTTPPSNAVSPVCVRVVRVPQEQQQLCAALQETKAFLEEQLADARARCSSVREVERDNLLLRQRIIDVEAVGVIRHSVSNCGLCLCLNVCASNEF